MSSKSTEPIEPNSSSDPIPMLDLSVDIRAIWPEIKERMDGVIETTQFINGPEVKNFEKNICAYLGVNHAVGLNSGTDALVIGLRACGVGPGDEVITTPFTFFATAESISSIGAVPVLVDIDPETYNLDPSKIEEKLSEKTKAIIPVHLFGHACDMNPIMSIAKKHGLAVIEDTAQAFGGSYRGKKLGTIGDAGTFSFFPSKNLGAFGDGGMVVCKDSEKSELSKMLRNHGGLNKYKNFHIGYNSRLDSLQAAVLDVKLKYIEDSNSRRREAASRYSELLKPLSGINVPCVKDYSDHVFHQYTLRIEGGRREKIQARLLENNISSAVYYPIPLHKLPVYESMKWSLPVCEKAADEVLSLPIGPSISLAEQERVVEVIKKNI